MPPDQELLAWLKLGLVAELTPASFRKLLGEFGDRKPYARRTGLRSAASSRTKSRMPSCEGRTTTCVDPRAALARRAQVPRHQSRGCCLSAALAGDHRPATATVCEGQYRTAQLRGAAVVGSRKCQPARQRQCGGLARELSDGGFTVISGLALGIDAAHIAADLPAPPLRSVVGTGLDIVYPARIAIRHIILAVQAAGFPSFARTPALSGNFPRRNR